MDFFFCGKQYCSAAAEESQQEAQGRVEEENGCQRSEQYLGFNVVPHQPLNEAK